MLVNKNIKLLLKSIPNDVKLVAVSKTKPIKDIREAYDAGQRIFGENRVQEMVDKQELLPKDIKWHMIGHLQKNKVKYMAGFVDLIHGVDSMNTLKEINKQAKKHNRTINCLLQARIAKEETKFGLNFNEINHILNSEELNDLKNVNIVGLMGMATFTDDKNQIDEEFKSLKSFFDMLVDENFKKTNINLKVLSMGMSGDFEIAIKNGSNMIRVGSAIFGARNYIA